MSSIGGGHRQRHTGRLLTYSAAYTAHESSVLYAAVISDNGRLVATPDGSVTFDRAEMSADEAVRQDIGRYIDEHEFGAGEPRQPNWTDYGPWK